MLRCDRPATTASCTAASERDSSGRATWASTIEDAIKLRLITDHHAGVAARAVWCKKACPVRTPAPEAASTLNELHRVGSLELDINAPLKQPAPPPWTNFKPLIYGASDKGIPVKRNNHELQLTDSRISGATAVASVRLINVHGCRSLRSYHIMQYARFRIMMVSQCRTTCLLNLSRGSSILKQGCGIHTPTSSDA